MKGLLLIVEKGKEPHKQEMTTTLQDYRKKKKPSKQNQHKWKSTQNPTKWK